MLLSPPSVFPNRCVRKMKSVRSGLNAPVQICSNTGCIRAETCCFRQRRFVFFVYIKLLSRVFLAYVFFCSYCACSPLSCRWMDHKFRQYSENSLNLLDMMAINSTEEQNSVAIPHHLYSKVSKASAEDKLSFTVHILKEVSALFEEDQSSSSWQEVTVENFLNVVNKQADELHSCIKGHGHMKKKNTKLHLYFKRLSNEILNNMGHSAEAWELIRREVKVHLMRADHLVSSLLTTN